MPCRVLLDSMWSDESILCGCRPVEPMVFQWYFIDHVNRLDIDFRIRIDR